MDTRKFSGRLGILASGCAVILAMLGPLMDATAGTEPPPLDLAAMALRPSDLAEAGFDDHGIDQAIMTDRPRAAAEFVEAHDWDYSVDDGEPLRDAGADRTYVLFHSVEHIIDDTVTSDHTVATFFMEYADTGAAIDGFTDAAASWIDADSLSLAPTDATFGDEYLLFEGTGTTSIDGGSFPRLTLLFRTGNLVSGITIYGLTGPDPEQDQIEQLGTRQLERIDAIRDNGGPGLGDLMPRLRLNGGLTNHDWYTMRDGEVIPLRGMTEAEVDDVQAELTAIGVVDRYRFEQIVFDGWSEMGQDIYAFYNGLIVTFEDEAAAEAYMDETRSDFERDSTAEIVDAPDLGDDAVAVFHEVPTAWDIPRERYVVIVRQGSMVFQVAHSTDAELAEEAGITLVPVPGVVHELAARQLACAEGEASCERSIRLPRDLRPVADRATGASG